MLSASYSIERQKLLVEMMNRRELDAVVTGLPHHVYYLSAFKQGWLSSAGMIVFADGRSVLIAPTQPDRPAADTVQTFDSNWMGTQRQEQPRLVAEMAVKLLQERHCSRIGIDASDVNSQLVMRFEGRIESMDSELWQIRRRKFNDEIELMRRAIKCTEAMYVTARETIAPGVEEIGLFNRLYAAATESAGEPLSAILGNDFACGTGGGPARGGHLAQSGQLWVLDLGPCFRGYFADNARTFCVDRKPTDAQNRAWEAITGLFPILEAKARPGVRCRDLFEEADAHLQSKLGKGLAHHLGHGVGLQPHEFPHLNRKWDDVLIEGEIFTAEPGVYGPELNGGMRIENQYLVTDKGVENLVKFPLSL